ncbi:Mitogen-activated protein kinase kinase kinase 5 [Ancistrocladus abbreviatus]
MHRFQKAVSSSPSSSSPSVSLPKSHRQYQQQEQQPQSKLTRARKLRYLQDQDIKDLDWPESPVRDNPITDGNDPSRLVATTTTSSVDHNAPGRFSSAVPQPLPLPDVGSLGDKVSRKLSYFGGDSFPLPSPKEAASVVGESEKERANRREREKERSHDSGQAGVLNEDANGRFTHRDARRNADAHRSVDRVETWSSGNVLQNVRTMGQPQENYNIQAPFRSAPNSGYSSPVLSPRRMSTGNMFSSYQMAQQVWSAPEMPHCDLTSGFPYAVFQENTAFDTSPSHSPPRKNPVRPRTSTSGPASPGHPKLLVDTSMTNRETNGHANVHPLPLPPGAASAAQSPSLPHNTSKPEFFPKKTQWMKGKLIGRGTFGSVYIATNRETGALCAMKEVELLPDDPKSAECMKQLEQEIKVLSQLKHPNIVQYYGSEIVEDRFYIYLEYVYPGSINKYVREHCGAITESVVRNFTRHILSGLAYLHSTKTIHRDIKGANLLVDSSGVVKLADFGMAKHLSGQAAELSLKGSPYWMAPELMQAVMQKDNSTNLALAVDIWSLGCTIIEMFTGKPPWSEYEGAAALFKVLKESPPIPETLSSEGKDFLRCCFRRNPADRPSASMLLEHRFMRNSQQLDIPPYLRAFNGLNLTDRTHNPGELPSFKFDQMPMSPTRQAINGNLGSNNETGQHSYPETSDLTVPRHHSPRSTLEAFPSLSPPRLDQTILQHGLVNSVHCMNWDAEDEVLLR